MEIDKALHSLSGISITFLFAFCFSSLGYGVALVIGYACAFVLAIAKEVYDYNNYGLFDWRDITATINPLVYFKYLLNNLKRK
ncbi:hypothetical protein [Ornithobacterium rhinotracheale]|uniref:hypothetical protein n=1 Tax=Ornithobacterium rhinotracheale TaxID=28251 RepID=UPI001FF58164|nr:hypothetical protein [Ornithobacterium rhinotracheale]MCK0201366.1 hypothetical protein [Ornithobacterium rhinotracheale]